MTQKKITGSSGETIAKDYLIKKGYKFIESNFRFMRYEIDLIFADEEKKILIFVEVKTRKNKKYGEPEYSVNFPKKLHIKRAAEGFLHIYRQYKNYDVRIDTVSLILNENNPPVISHIENAF